MREIADKLIKLDYFQLFAYFLGFAFLGWIFETFVVLVSKQQFTYRGFFFAYRNIHYYFPAISENSILGKLRLIWGLPMINIYGIGGIVIFFALNHFKHQPIKLFFYGAVFMTLFELFGSYFCTMVLGRAYWNYSKDFMNFEGRICLQSTLAWGLLSVIVVIGIEPEFQKLYRQLQQVSHFQVYLSLLAIYAVICMLVKYFIDPDIIPN
ncbi:putative ABC transporter permease [Melissococcus plutonius]|uniref:Permease n=3 Tax=Melissococcus plutonius TaxID=33970 RepID=F3Y9F9_MELPT|nr:putative ABC transporter permease [Melissococcus plutonius]BAL62475.1 permease [Melissococcus plutonius DAT561]AIM25656.1 putative membrane protein [Melissococcus plutonius S1]KMT32882.1 putative membrane protein [Melissococcus plutonius]KMT34541.1 putative membrane protein [Melissococcus plutonius]KMT40472.1 putative membrane protein [Melissococcus plutonius]